MKFIRVTKDYFVGDGGICLKRMRGKWFLKRGHWYECTLSGEQGVVRLDSLNVHVTVFIV